MQKKSKHLYRVYLKTNSENPEGDNKGLMKSWHTSNLINFQDWIDTEYPQWKFFNVYDRETNRELARFTKYQRCTVKKI